MTCMRCGATMRLVAEGYPDVWRCPECLGEFTEWPEEGDYECDGCPDCGVADADVIPGTRLGA